MLVNARIIRIISNLYTVKCEDNTILDVRARGVFRNEKISPLVGDQVIIDKDKQIIEKINERKNELKRPNIANVDISLIIASVKEPDLDLYLLDKLISLSIYNSIEPVICFTKIDLLNNLEEIEKLKNYYNSIGIKTFYNTETEELKKYLKNKEIVLCGQSGAGKSSLINRLNEKLNLKTNAISHALGRGKHTTRHTEMFEIENILISDTPGFSSLSLDMDKENLKFTFPEFTNECKFRDCMHDKEIGCLVKEEYEKGIILNTRYENYVSFLKELEK